MFFARSSIRCQLASLVAACVLPVWVVAGFLVCYVYSSKVREVNGTMLDSARSLTTMVDRELASSQAALLALATSTSFERGNLKEVYREAQQLQAEYPGARVLLASRRGDVIVNSAYPFGTRLKRRNNQASVEAVFATGRPTVSDLFVGSNSRVPLIAVDVPVFRHGQVAYDLSMTFTSLRLAELFAAQRLPRGWYVSLFDRQKVVVARMPGHERHVGHRARPALAAAFARAAEGTAEWTNVDGVKVLSSFSRCSMSGWTVAVGVPKAAVMKEIYRWLVLAAATAAGISLLGIVLAMGIAHRIATSIKALVAPAEAIGSGVPVAALDLSGVKETVEVANALRLASELLQQSKERFRTLVMTAPVLVAELDLQGEILFANRLFAGFDLGGALGTNLCGYLDQDSSRALKRALTLVGDSASSRRLLLRVPDRNGALRWYDAMLGPVVVEGAVNSVVVCCTDLTERKEMEDRLEKVSREQRIVLETAPVAICLVVDRKMVWVNCKMAELFQYSKMELEGATSRMLCPGEEVHLKMWEEAFPVLARGEIYQSEQQLLRHDGKNITVRYLGKVVDAADLSQGVIWCLEDVTAGRLAEETLRKQSLAVQQSPISIVITDTEGKIEFVNPMFTETTGYSQEEVLGENPRMLQRAGSRPEVYRQLWETITAGKIWEGDFHNRKKSGEPFWEHAKIAPLKNAAGIVTNFVAVKQNITEQKLAKDLLHLSEERFRQLFDHSNDAIFILNPSDYRIIDCNAEAEQVFGYRRVDLVGTGFFDLMVEVDDSLKEWIDIGERSFVQIDQVTMRREDASHLKVSARCKKITLNSHQVFYCSLRDITDRLRIEGEAAAAQAGLIQAEKMASLGLLVSGMAHEINNPNNSILANSELLVRTWSSAVPILEQFYRENGEFKLGSFKFSESRDIIPRLFSGLVDGSERIRAIVEMLKDFSRQDTGDTNAPFDVNRVITNAIAILNHEIKKRCHRFYLESGDGIPAALGNAQQIEQVMINLIMNALQALPGPQRAVRVQTSPAPEGDAIFVAVTDEGEGMSAEVMKRIAEPFFTTRAENGGTGLGLSITSSLVQKNHGSISFASAPARGTTVTLRLRAFVPQPKSEA